MGPTTAKKDGGSRLHHLLKQSALLLTLGVGSFAGCLAADPQGALLQDYGECAFQDPAGRALSCENQATEIAVAVRPPAGWVCVNSFANWEIYREPNPIAPLWGDRFGLLFRSLQEPIGKSHGALTIGDQDRRGFYSWATLADEGFLEIPMAITDPLEFQMNFHALTVLNASENLQEGDIARIWTDVDPGKRPAEGVFDALIRLAVDGQHFYFYGGPEDDGSGDSNLRQWAWHGADFELELDYHLMISGGAYPLTTSEPQGDCTY